MNRPPAILWLVLLLFLLPTAAGRILLDVVGGVALVVVAVPLLLTGLGWIGWKLLQIQATTAAASSSAGSTVGTPSEASVPASQATIDVKAQDVESSS